jgi:hypothetical protein
VGGPELAYFTVRFVKKYELQLKQITSLMLKEVQKRVRDLNRGLMPWVSWTGQMNLCIVMLHDIH